MAEATLCIQMHLHGAREAWRTRVIGETGAFESCFATAAKEKGGGSQQERAFLPHRWLRRKGRTHLTIAIRSSSTLFAAPAAPERRRLRPDSSSPAGSRPGGRIWAPESTCGSASPPAVIAVLLSPADIASRSRACKLMRSV